MKSAVAVAAFAFALSQAFRTLPSIISPGIATEFDAGPAELGQFGMLFHLAFALLQVPFGIAIDRFGARGPMMLSLAIAALGSALAANASTLAVLDLAQVLIGAGCAPALVSAMWILARDGAGPKFAARTGQVMTLGSAGILATSLPFAWLIEAAGWRSAFVVLGCLCAAATALCLLLPGRTLRTDTRPPDRASNSLWSVVVPGIGGLLAIAFVGYSSVLTFRALWVVPFFSERHGLSLEQSGLVTLAFSVAIAISPALLGWLGSRSNLSNRRITTGVGFAIAISYGFLVSLPKMGVAFDASLMMLLGFASSVPLLVFAAIRENMPPEIAGRALSVANLAVFTGIAFAQWGTGIIGELALTHGMRPFRPILACLGLFALSGTMAFLLLPRLHCSKSGRTTLN